MHSRNDGRYAHVAGCLHSKITEGPLSLPVLQRVKHLVRRVRHTPCTLPFAALAGLAPAQGSLTLWTDVQGSPLPGKGLPSPV